MLIYTIISSLCFFLSAIIGVRSIFNINVILEKLSSNSSMIRHKWLMIKRISIFIVGVFLLFTFLVFQGPEHFILFVISVTFLGGTVLVFYIVINSRDSIEKLTKIEKYLLTTVDDLQVTNQSLEEFAYVATHDLRAPVINLQNLLNFYDDTYQDIEENKEVMVRIKKSIGILNNTLNSLIEVVMLKNSSELVKEQVNIMSVTQDILQSLMASIEKFNIKTSVSIDPKLYVFGHPSKIQSILSNLISNAIKYRSDKRSPVISISSQVEGDRIIVKVSDNGIGINMDLHGDRIFGLFNRIQKDNKGKGIGLYNVRNQVEAMGGQVWLESVPDVGSTFYISFKR